MSGGLVEGSRGWKTELMSLSSLWTDFGRKVDQITSDNSTYIYDQPQTGITRSAVALLAWDQTVYHYIHHCLFAEKATRLSSPP
jgi:hypothetical protein